MSRHMVKPVFLLLVLLSLLQPANLVNAATPCAPFEGGRVDAKILATMREAARDGRLYRVDPATSRVGFCVRHVPFQEFRGEFTNIVGGLAIPPDPSHYGQALLLVHTASLMSENSALVPMAKGSHFMDTDRYPEILYVGRKFEWITESHAHIYGEMTLHGNTHPVMFDADLDVPESTAGQPADRIHLRGFSAINRFNYDMRSHRFFVSESIRLCIDANLLRWAG